MGRALPIASRLATGTKTKLLPAEKSDGLWFSKRSRRDQPHGAGQALDAWDGTALDRKLGRIEFGERLLAAPAAHADAHGADGLLQHDETVALPALSLEGVGLRKSASRTAVPTVGCPANGSSAAGVKMRARAVWARFCAFSTNTVSGRLNSRAITCMRSGESSSASSTTPGIAAEALLGEHVENVIREPHEMFLSKRRRLQFAGFP